MHYITASITLYYCIYHDEQNAFPRHTKLISNKVSKCLGLLSSMQHLLAEMLGWIDLEIQSKAQKCILVFKCPNGYSLYLLDYFIRNHTIHTYKTSKGNVIHLQNPKLTLGRNTEIFRGGFFFADLPTSVKEIAFHF